MYRTKNTLSENIRAKSIALLNEHLAAGIDLHGQTKQAHWNVRGDPAPPQAKSLGGRRSLH